MLSSIFRRAGKFLIGLSDGRPSTEPPRGSHTSRQSSDPAIRTASGGGTNGRQLLAGSIRLLDLDDIRRELGVNWGEVSRGVYQIVEDTIAENLLAGDIQERHGPKDMFRI